MPAQKDETAWKPVEGDHADDQSYERDHLAPGSKPTDERRTEADLEDAEQRNKEDEKQRAAAEKAAKENS